MWAHPPAAPPSRGWATTGSLETPQGTYPLLAVTTDEQLLQDATVQNSYWGRQSYTPWVARGPQAQKACQKLLSDEDGTWNEDLTTQSSSYGSAPTSPGWRGRAHVKQSPPPVLIITDQGGGWSNTAIQMGPGSPPVGGGLSPHHYCLTSAPTTLHDAHERVRSPGTAQGHGNFLDRPNSGDFGPWSSRPVSRYAQGKLSVVVADTAKYAAKHVAVVKGTQKPASRASRSRQGSTGRPLTPTTIADWDLLLEPNRARMMKQLDAVTNLMRVPTPPGALIPPPQSRNSSHGPYNSTGVYATSPHSDTITHWPSSSDLHDDNRLLINFDSDILPGLQAMLQQPPPLPTPQPQPAGDQSQPHDRLSQTGTSVSPRTRSAHAPRASGGHILSAAVGSKSAGPHTRPAAALEAQQPEMLLRSATSVKRAGSTKHGMHVQHQHPADAAGHPQMGPRTAWAGTDSQDEVQGQVVQGTERALPQLSMVGRSASHLHVSNDLTDGPEHASPSTPPHTHPHQHTTTSRSASLNRSGSSKKSIQHMPAEVDTQSGLPTQSEALPPIARPGSAPHSPKTSLQGPRSARLSIQDQEDASSNSFVGRGASATRDATAGSHQDAHSPTGHTHATSPHHDATTGGLGSPPQPHSKGAAIPVEASFAPLAGSQEEELAGPMSDGAMVVHGGVVREKDGIVEHRRNLGSGSLHGLSDTMHLAPEASFQVEPGVHGSSGGLGEHQDDGWDGPRSAFAEQDEAEEHVARVASVASVGSHSHSAGRTLAIGDGDSGQVPVEEMLALDLDPLSQSRPGTAGEQHSARSLGSRKGSGSLGRQVGSAHSSRRLGSAGSMGRPGSSSIKRAAWPPIQLDDSHIPGDVYEVDADGMIQEDDGEGEVMWGLPSVGEEQQQLLQHESGMFGQPGSQPQNPVQTSGIGYTVVRSVAARPRTREEVEEERRQGELQEVVGNLGTPASRQAARDASRAAKALNKMSDSTTAISGGVSAGSPPAPTTVNLVKTSTRRFSNASGTPATTHRPSQELPKVTRPTEKTAPAPPPPVDQYHHKKGVTEIGTVHMQDIWA